MNTAANPEQGESFHRFGFCIWSGNPACYPVWHKHSEVEINFVESGWLEYRIGPHLIRVLAGETAVFWGIATHRLIALAPATRLHWLSLPLPMLLQWDMPLELSAALLRGDLLRGGVVPVATVQEKFATWKLDVEAASPDREKLVNREIQNWLCRLWFDDQKRPPSKLQKPNVAEESLGHIGRMACFAALNYRENISVKKIAEAAGIHPHYAMNLFRRVCQMSLTEYVTRLRVCHAQRLLQTTNHKILDIGYESGFRTSSRFYSAFRQIAGLPPGKARFASPVS